MDVLLSAVASDLTGRLVSFLIGKYQEHSSTDDSAVKLQRLLLRARVIVDEAEGRVIANWAMLLQLNQLRRELCRGAYVLDDLAGSSSGSSDGIAVAAESLEAVLSDTRELVVLLGSCPRVNRQPYSAYLFIESCMFGRQVEKEQIIGFLLQPSHKDLDVLPVVGPHDVGKRTVVEHVCLDERVRERYTEIHHLGTEDLRSRDHEHHRSLMDRTSSRSQLFVVDLADSDASEEAWRQFHSFMRRHASRGSRIIIISRTERHSTLGTVPPLRLHQPRREELWYLFKNLAFGGADPDERPDLLRVAVALFEGFLLDASPFTTVHNIAASLRGDMSARAWRRMLHVSTATTVLRPLLERDCPQGKGKRAEFCFLCRPVNGAAATPLLFCDRRKSTCLAGDDELPNVTLLELVTGGAALPVGGETWRFDVLVWRSLIPPYASYVVACDVVRARQAVAGEARLRKRKRGRQHDMSRRASGGSRPSST